MTNQKPNLSVANKVWRTAGAGTLFLLTVAAIVFTRIDIEEESFDRPRELVSPPKSLAHFAFGHHEVLADLLWIRALGDFDYCEKKRNERDCENNSWLYHMLDLITDLSPYFRLAYSAGGMALTVIVSDIKGASMFFDKATERLPKDWVILYKAAYHFIYEDKNLPKAASLVERAARNGAPDWVYSLAARLYSEGGRKMMALRLIEELQQSGFSQDVIDRMKEKLNLRAPPKREQNLRSAAPEREPEREDEEPAQNSGSTPEVEQ